MTTTDTLLQGLNPQQYEAVTAGSGPILVMAGPGSGKTGVLTRRVAYLINETRVSPKNILAVTFTNKAAGEMKHRVESFLGEPPPIMVGTFHSICARLLRIEYDATPYGKDFVIFDTDDQTKVIEQAMSEINIDSRKFTPRSILYQISSFKNEMKLPHQVVAHDYMTEIVARVYPRYQTILVDNNAMDFDDLLLQMVVMLQKNDLLRDKYQRRFEYVLVDEFQDTNTVQYRLVELWGKPQNNIFAVGDEDQSIYAFRGADYRNVLRFRQDYPNARVILLEQNYRSTQVVLDTARAIIDRNTNRTPKALFTDRSGGDRLTVHEAYDDEYEARYVIEQIEGLRKRQGYTFNQIAVMYRTNAQSRALEDRFIKEGIPYTLVGGVGFYKRREVKDLIAYLRVINNPNDKISFARIINVPRRGIGDKSLQEFQAVAASNSLNYHELLDKLLAAEKIALPARTNKVFSEFGLKVREWQQLNIAGNLVNLFDSIVYDIGYNLHLQQSSNTPEEAAERVDNVRELRGLILRADEDQIPLAEWLADQSLMTDVEEVDNNTDKVTLLTLHAAKGLEYPVVFITGLEEGLLPHFRSLEEPEGIQEERRLLYVGITRARDILFLTYAFRRTAWGSSDVRDVSRFLEDIPSELVISMPDRLTGEKISRNYLNQTTWDTGGGRTAERRPQNNTNNRPVVNQSNSGLDRLRQDLQRESEKIQRDMKTKPASGLPDSSKILRFPGRPSNGTVSYKAGQQVKHPLFGKGIVKESRLDAGDEMVTVAFDDPRYGTKTLMANLANMTVL